MILISKWSLINADVSAIGIQNLQSILNLLDWINHAGSTWMCEVMTKNIVNCVFTTMWKVRRKTTLKCGDNKTNRFSNLFFNLIFDRFNIYLFVCPLALYKRCKR